MFVMMAATARGESPMQPGDGISTGVEVGLERFESPWLAPQEYATHAPLCDASAPLLQQYRADAPFEGLPQVLIDAFTKDGRRDLWLLADCPAVLEAFKPLACVPPHFPQWLWCKQTKGGSLSHVRRLAAATGPTRPNEPSRARSRVDHHLSRALCIPTRMCTPSLPLILS